MAIQVFLGILFAAFAAATATIISECGPFPTANGNHQVLRFYVWDVSAAFENQVVTVLPFPGQSSSGFSFGSGVAIYNKLTALPIYNSTECGRNEGFAIATSLDLSGVNLVLNHKFHGVDGYIGSSGLFNASNTFNETPIVGGVGRTFSRAKGTFKAWAITKYGPNNSNTLIRAEIHFSRNHHHGF